MTLTSGGFRVEWGRPLGARECSTGGLTTHLVLARRAGMKPTRICSFDSCERKHYAHGLCRGHYAQEKRSQDLKPLRSQITPEQRFIAKVRKTGSCWEWVGSIGSHGYGQFTVDGRMVLAHRFSWELANGLIPDGMDIDHRCSNRKCVNPGHLRVTTRAQNLQHRQGAQTNSASGIRGVSWDKRRKSWVAYASLEGRRYHGGYHPTVEAADAAARVLRKELHTHDDHDQWVKNNQGA